jgi:hypothetical protein
MAGAYPDLPNNRMAWHLDGSVGITISQSNVVNVLSGEQMATLNDELTATGVEMGDANDFNGWSRLGVVFPEDRQLTHVFVSYRGDGGGGLTGPSRFPTNPDYLFTSPDTTNGLDGTWTQRLNPIPWNTSFQDPTQSRLSTVAVPTSPTVRGLYIGVVKGVSSSEPVLSALHLYGKITAATDRLELWHPTSDVRLAPAALDWGNTPRSTTATTTFRVKNRSASLTANSITVSLVDSTDSSPSFTDAHDLDIGSGYAATQNIGNLEAGAISGVITLRRTWSSTQPLSAWATIVRAQASSWT